MCKTGLDLHSVLSQNPLIWILSTAFWGHVQATQGIPDELKKDPSWRNGSLRHWMKFLTNTKVSLGEVHMTKYALWYSSVRTNNSWQDNYWSKHCKITQLKAQKMWFKCRRKPHKHGVLKNKGEKHISLKDQIPDPLLSTSAVLQSHIHPSHLPSKISLCFWQIFKTKEVCSSQRNTSSVRSSHWIRIHKLSSIWKSLSPYHHTCLEMWFTSIPTPTSFNKQKIHSPPEKTWITIVYQ